MTPAVSGAVMFCIGPYGEADAARLFCIARSSPNNSLDEDGTLLEQIVWNSCFNDGLSCSRLIEEISETTCPTRAIASMLSVTISFVSI